LLVALAHAMLRREGTMTLVTDASEHELPPSGRTPSCDRSAAAVRTIPGSRGSVLIIDDDAMVRETLARIVANLGFEPFLAEDGEVGVREFRCRSKQLTLTFLGIIMPGPSAEETLDGILAIDPGARVVLMSGWSPDDLGERVRGGAYLGVSFLRKPFFYRQIQALFEGGAAGEPGSVPP
jgi:ActR/RegA family two-component response regulator